MARTATKARASQSKAAAASKAAQPRRSKVQRKPTGRPTYLTPETTESICSILRSGGYLSTACNYTGIGQATVFGWLKRGREAQAQIDARRSEGIEAQPSAEEAPFVEFLEAVTRAEAFGEVKAAAMLSKGIEAEMLMRFRMRDEEGNYYDEVRSVPDWTNRIRASTSLLERRFRSGWARGEIVDATISAEVHTEITVSVEEQRKALETILVAAEEAGAFIAGQAALGDGGER